MQCPVCRATIAEDPSQWMAFQTDSLRGRTYFQDTDSGDTQWQRPAGSHAFWQQIIVQPGNKSRFFNLATGESCSKRPASMRKKIYVRQCTVEQKKEGEDAGALPMPASVVRM